MVMKKLREVEPEAEEQFLKEVRHLHYGDKGEIEPGPIHGEN